MTDSSDDYKVGYGRPPRQHRWKSGRSGNPRHRRPKAPRPLIGIIDKLLSAPVTVTVNGEATKMPAISAIVMRLHLKQISGSAKATRILLKYQEFAGRNTQKRRELVFARNDYTDALSNRARVEGDRDE